MFDKSHQNIKFIYYKYFIVLIIVLMIISKEVIAQNTIKNDTSNIQVTLNKKTETFSSDTIHSQTAALDIASDRGLFIQSQDKKMQMRILGSVRAAINYTDQDLKNKLSLNPYDIPTEINSLSPNYYASLSQTRIGFEVTRRTKERGDIFIRIESDFNSSTNNLRIRHAYGQFRHLLVGQTWSLFANVNFQPATVSSDGVVGSISIRTPQIRFFGNITPKINWAAAIEYSNPDFIIPDSINISVLQVIPDLTGQISYNSTVFSCRAAIVITTISGRNIKNKINYGFGIGGSFSGKFNIKKNNNIYFSITYGQAISHFMSVFSGKHEDAAYNPANQKFETQVSSGGFIAYGTRLAKNVTANVSLGYAAISNKDFQTANAFSNGYNALLNVFWQPTEGARMGIEYANGQRYDKSGNKGMANKLSLLLYYDF